MKKLTQREKILKVLRDVRNRSDMDSYPKDYLFSVKGELWISSRYFKQVMLISECNGRISEARVDGFDIGTLDIKDQYGFAYHRLLGEPKRIEHRIEMRDGVRTAIPYVV